MNEWQFSTKDGREIIVRHAKIDDAKELHETFCEVVDEGKWLPTLHPNSNRAEWAEWIRRTYANREVLLISFVENEYAGHLSLQPEEWNASKHVARLGVIVKKGFRNIGVGQSLMLAAEHAARTQKYEKIILSTFESNLVARTLYEHVGYRIVGKRMKHFLMPDGYIDEILMEKML